MNGTPLHWAAENGRYEVFKRLFSRGAMPDLEKMDSQGPTPLLCAASGFPGSSCQDVHAVPSRQLDWEKTVRLLVEAGANLTVSDRRDLSWAATALLHDTLLGYVARWGSADIVRYLVNKGSDIHQQRSYPQETCFPYGVGSDKVTPLHRAAHHWNADGVQALLEPGANPDATEGNGRQPLRWKTIWKVSLAARRADWVTGILRTYAPDEYAAWSRRAARTKALLLAAGADGGRCIVLGRTATDVEEATSRELCDGRAKYLERLEAPPRRDVGMGRGFRGGRGGGARVLGDHQCGSSHETGLSRLDLRCQNGKLHVTAILGRRFGRICLRVPTGVPYIYHMAQSPKQAERSLTRRGSSPLSHLRVR